MLSLQEIAAAIDGKVRGNKVIAPAPGHSQRDQSLAVWLSHDEREYSVACLSPHDWQSCRDYIDERLGRDWQRRVESSPEDRERAEKKRRADELAQLQYQAERKAFALEQWRSGIKPHGTIVDEYLARRGIVHLPASIRRLPSGMIAAVQGRDGKIIAAQATKLTADSASIGKHHGRETIGKLHDGAIRLGLAGSVLGLAEGTETAMSAMQMTGVTCWATLGAHRLANVWIPDCVSELHLFVDNNEAGFAGARACRAKHQSNKSIVIRRPPEDCGDWNDFLRKIADRDGREIASHE